MYEMGRTALAADEGLGSVQNRDDFADWIDGAAWATLAAAGRSLYRAIDR